MSAHDAITPAARSETILDPDGLASFAHLGGEYDFVVCGAGAAGSVVAGRLAADPAARVLLLEAGGDDEAASVLDPDLWPTNFGTERDWGYVAEPSGALNGRGIPYSMGRGLGGGTSINVSVWSRGHLTDWDSYAKEAQDDAWNYEQVLGLYRRIEDWQGSADPRRRGTGGPVHVQPAQDVHPFFDALLDAGESTGLHRYDSPNGQMAEVGNGCAVRDEIIHDGRRQSPYRSYVHPLRGRENLTVLTGALVTRVLLEGSTATGVEFRHDGRTVQVRATTEVVLSLGALQTPKVLLQSGIGPAEELERVGIPVRHHLPGVGRNLDDHMVMACVAEGTGVPVPPLPVSQAALTWSADGFGQVPDFILYASGSGDFSSPESAARYNAPEHPYRLMLAMRPRSRGELHLSGPDASDPLRIHTGFLTDPADVQLAVDGVQKVHEIIGAQALAPFTVGEVAPGNVDRGDVEGFIRDAIGTFWHQCGTAKMGHDTMSVVDGALRVHGIDRLRVADASVLPHVTTGNTMAPCVVVGERAADEIKAQHHMS